jgi:predicted neuraminidase
MTMLRAQFIFHGTTERPSCHCASIAERPGGGLFATWYAGSREGAADVAILCATHDGERWEEPRVLFDPPERPGGNTVVYRHDDSLWHFVDVIEGPEGWESAVLYLLRSHDGGETWTEAQVFDEEFGIMVRHAPIQLSGGRLLLPAYDEKVWRGFAFITDDEGDTWRRSGWMVAEAGCIQPTIIERSDGTLHALLRSDGNVPHAWECSSSDGGESWTQCVPSELRNPNSGADMILLSNGQTIACYNDSIAGRTPLTLALSEDEGRTWVAKRDVETDQGEYSYPTLIEASDGTVHLVYTWRRERIRWMNFAPEWVTQE